MTDEPIPLTRPDLSEEAIREVVACLRGGWLTMGPRVERFEAAATSATAAAGHPGADPPQRADTRRPPRR